MKARLDAIACLLLAAAAAQAQGVPETRLPPPFVPMWGERAFERQTVRGAPFSARTETELVQTLADGNRISGRWTGFVARDSAGRIRREQPLGAIGPLLAAPDSPRLTVIVDPVARADLLPRRAGEDRPPRGLAGGGPARRGRGPRARTGARHGAVQRVARLARDRRRRWPRARARPTSSRPGGSATSDR